MASLAIRAKSQEPLIVAMMAMFLQIDVGDVREDIVILILTYAAAHKFGLDPRSVFMEAARQFGLNDISGLEAFLKRSDEDKSLDSMGYVEGADRSSSLGLRFSIKLECASRLATLRNRNLLALDPAVFMPSR